MEAVSTWEWLLAAFFLVGSAFCSGTETALTALGFRAAAPTIPSRGSAARSPVNSMAYFLFFHSYRWISISGKK